MGSFGSRFGAPSPKAFNIPCLPEADMRNLSTRIFFWIKAARKHGYQSIW